MTERSSIGLPHFRYEPDPEMPGWMTWEVVGCEAFNAQIEPVRLRRDDDGRARVRFWPTSRHQNMGGHVHGGAIMAFVDMAIFAGARVHGIPSIEYSVTIDASVQFIDGAKIGVPTDAVVEVLRETGRMVFVRGLIEQESRIVASFTGTFRKSRNTTAG